MGKGSARRPPAIDRAEFERLFDAVFAPPPDKSQLTLFDKPE
jgi:hypothetical protein